MQKSSQGHLHLNLQLCIAAMALQECIRKKGQRGPFLYAFCALSTTQEISIRSRDVRTFSNVRAIVEPLSNMASMLVAFVLDGFFILGSCLLCRGFVSLASLRIQLSRLMVAKSVRVVGAIVESVFMVVLRLRFFFNGSFGLFYGVVK